jgi:lysophospholipase L1-like esterase
MCAGPIRLLSCGLVVLLGCSVFAEDKKDDKDNPAAKAIAREGNKGWMARHNSFVQRAKKGDVDVVFLGDSITHGWEHNGKKVWESAFDPLKGVNFGIGGDQTGHVLWRITEGKELEPIKPKVAVLMIGTNNMRAHSAEQIAGGVKAIVEELRKQKPDIKVLVLGIFPRNPKAYAPDRKKIKETNAIIAKLDDGKSVVYKDIGEKFLEKDGSLDKKIMYDYLHLTPKGYQIWANAIKGDVEKLLK